MAADWKLQQAVYALRSGAQSVLTEDPDADLSLMPELAEDMAALETAMRQLIRQTQNAQDIATCARQRASEANDRARRFEARAGRYKGLMLAAMDAMGWKKREWAEATISVRSGQPNVIITDENLLPQEFTRTKIEPDKESIRTALKTGETVPGAVLSNNLPSLQIRSN